MGRKRQQLYFTDIECSRKNNILIKCKEDVTRRYLGELVNY